MQTVLIIGGGASGMMAAVTAAENRQNRVILIEKHSRVGRKLLTTGNGCCNLSNADLSEANYFGEDSRFVKPALDYFGLSNARFLPLTRALTEPSRAAGFTLTVCRRGASSMSCAFTYAPNIDLRCETEALSIKKEGPAFNHGNLSGTIGIGQAHNHSGRRGAPSWGAQCPDTGSSGPWTQPHGPVPFTGSG